MAGAHLSRTPLPSCASRASQGWQPPQVYAWGNNAFGQLGLGDKRTRRSPALVSGLWALPVAQLAAGAAHSAALTSAGFLFTWGANSRGQLGLPPVAEVAAQHQVRGHWDKSQDTRKWVNPVAQLAAGAAHSAALTSAGLLFTWRTNSQGQLSLPVVAGVAAQHQARNEKDHALDVKRVSLCTRCANLHDQLGLPTVTEVAAQHQVRLVQELSIKEAKLRNCREKGCLHLADIRGLMSQRVARSACVLGVHQIDAHALFLMPVPLLCMLVEICSAFLQELAKFRLVHRCTERQAGLNMTIKRCFE